jgi:hypothetical protein
VSVLLLDSEFWLLNPVPYALSPVPSESRL